MCLCLCAQSLAGSKRQVDLEGRLAAITETLTSDVYKHTCLGLFERHKLMLSFQMAVKILQTGPKPLNAQVGVCCERFSAGRREGGLGAMIRTNLGLWSCNRLPKPV
jgi:hypothetical protein